MDIWDSDKLLLFVAFVIPGFVSLKAYEILFLASPKETAGQLVDAIAYSCFNYAVLFPAIYYIDQIDAKATHPILFALFCSLVLFLAPILWVIVLKVTRSSKWLQQWLPHPTERPWDYVFGAKNPYWVIVTLKDGKKIGGKYGFKSFSSCGPSREQLFIEETWVVNEDGGLERPRVSTAGTLIVGGEVESIEFFKWN